MVDTGVNGGIYAIHGVFGTGTLLHRFLRRIGRPSSDTIDDVPHKRCESYNDLASFSVDSDSKLCPRCGLAQTLYCEMFFCG